MEAILKAEKRRPGSRYARALRREGRIPASIQHTTDAEHVDISIDEHEFLTSRRHSVHLFDIDVGGSSETAIVRELQWDTFGQSILHVEFRRVVRGQKIESLVELSFEGMPKSGVLNQLLNEITISSIPSKIPDDIEVPVGELAEGDTVTAADLKLPEGVELAIEGDTPVAVVSSPQAEIEEPAEGEAEGELEGELEGEEGLAGEEPGEPSETPPAE